MPTTTIPLDSAQRDRLKRYGTMGMTYTDIIRELLDKVERDAFLDDIRRRAAAGDWVDLDDV